MKILWAVILDLYNFARELVRFSPRKVEQKYLPPGISSQEINDTKKEEESDFVKVADILNYAGNIGYVSVTSAKVFQRPVWAIDTVIGSVPLGSKVQIHSYQGRFVRIATPSCEGWALKDEITTDKGSIWPEFVDKQVYEANDKVTTCLRALINDDFFTTELYLPLQPTEYITYRLLKNNLVLPWPQTKPREVGLWHEILKGQPGIIAGLEAKTSSIMEGFTKDDKPFLAFVEAVRVDGFLEITSIGKINEGQYRKETLSKEEAFTLRPVYIQRI